MKSMSSLMMAVALLSVGTAQAQSVDLSNATVCIVKKETDFKDVTQLTCDGKLVEQADIRSLSSLKGISATQAISKYGAQLVQNGLKLVSCPTADYCVFVRQ